MLTLPSMLVLPSQLAVAAPLLRACLTLTRPLAALPLLPPAELRSCVAVPPLPCFFVRLYHAAPPRDMRSRARSGPFKNGSEPEPSVIESVMAALCKLGAAGGIARCSQVSCIAPLLPPSRETRGPLSCSGGIATWLAGCVASSGDAMRVGPAAGLRMDGVRSGAERRPRVPQEGASGGGASREMTWLRGGAATR